MTMAMQWVAQCLKGNYNGKNADMAKNSDITSSTYDLENSPPNECCWGKNSYTAKP